MRPDDRFEVSEFLHSRPSVLDVVLHPFRAGEIAEARSAQRRALMLKLCGKVERYAHPKLGEVE